MFRAPPSGTVDRLFAAARHIRELEHKVISALEQAGYSEVMVPLIERDEVFSSDSTVRFVDRHGELLGLRADFTGPVARVVSTRLGNEPVVRLSYRGEVFRDVDARSARRRQLQQAGYELVDSGDVASDAEAIGLAFKISDAIGLQNVRLSLGSAELIHALCPNADASIRRALDRRDRSRLPVELLPVLELTGGVEMLARAKRDLPATARPALDRLSRVVDTLDENAKRTVIDLAEVRPWAYYTGIVFDLFADGSSGPVAGGGRYDSLAGRYGKSRPAVGASFQLDAVAEIQRDITGTRAEKGLVVALPKGRILKGVLERLGALGPTASELESRKLIVSGGAPLLGTPISFLRVKDADVPAYVEHGVADLGIVGLDVLEEKPASVLEPLDTGLGRCRLCLCGRPGTSAAELSAKGVLRVATKYPKVTRLELELRGLAAEIVPLEGSVELAVLANLADLIVDMVETGATLRANGLVELEELMSSSARVIVGRGAWRLKQDAVRALLSALKEKT